MTAKKTVSRSILKQSLILIGVLFIPLATLLLVHPFLEFQQEIVEYRNSYTEKTKHDTKEQVQQAIARLSFDHSQSETRVRTMLQDQVYAAHAIATKVYEQNKNKMTEKELRSVVRETLRVIRYNDGRGYFFATNLDGIEELFVDRPELEGKNLLGMQDTNGQYVIRDMIKIARSEAGEAFYDYTWTKPGDKGKEFPKLAFVKRFEPFGWFIGTGEYMDTVNEQVQAEAVKWLDYTKYGKDNYLFAFKYGGTYVAHVGQNIKTKAADANYWDLKDINGVLINQELQRQAQQGGGFVEYVWRKPSTGKETQKLAYAEAFEPWGWVIGTGVYLDDIEAAVAKKRAKMWQTTRENVVFLGIAMSVALLISLLISIHFAKRLKGELAIFQIFFKKASSDAETIAVEQLHHDELQALARTGNDMLAERKKAEEALRDSEERYKTLVETTGDGMAILQDGFIVFVSQRFCEILDRLSSDIVGTHFSKLLKKDELFRIDELHVRYISGESDLGVTETEVIRPDGSSIAVEVNGSRYTFEGKESVLISLRDINERELAKESLQINSLRWQQAQKVAKIGNWEFDIGSGLIWGSEEAFRIYGIPLNKKENPDQLLPLDEVEACIPDNERIHQALVDLIMENKTYELEYEVVRRDNFAVQIIYSKAERELDSDGNPVRITGTIQDITDRVRKDRCLVESEERYRRLTENAKDLIWRTTPNGQVLFVNAAVTNILGYSPEEALDMTIDQYFTPESIINSEKKVEQALASDPPKENYHVELEYQHKNGDIVQCEANVSIIMGEDGHPLFFEGISRDITKRKRSEKEKTKLESQLQQAMKMEAVGRLAGGVAHDFNNLLTGISGNIGLALLDLDTHDPLYETLTEVNKAAESAASLTRQLLAFSHKQIIEPKVVDLNEIISSLYKMLVRLIGEDIELTTVPSKHLGSIKVDPGQFEQILVNLAVNARDAMPHGGKLIIETGNVEFDGKYCKNHPHTKPGNYTMLAVSDTGLGMSEEVKSHLFEPFFTTKPKGRGTGLGLATIYGAVQQANGLIDVYSEEGHGTTFKIYLPQVEGKTERIGKDDRKLDMPSGTETILLVEDEAIVRNLAMKVLNRLGYKVLHAPDGGKAFMLAEEYKDQIDVLMTDVVMPGINGRQLADRLIKIHPEMKILFTSGYTENVIVHHGIVDEDLNFIGKPYSPQALAKKLRAVLDEKK